MALLLEMISLERVTEHLFDNMLTLWLLDNF